MTKTYTREQVQKKYHGKYISFACSYDYDKRCHMYSDIKTYRSIHEGTTLGQDVGTPLEYSR